jgi:hypothetical protein
VHNAALPNSEPKLREIFDKLARHWPGLDPRGQPPQARPIAAQYAPRMGATLVANILAALGEQTVAVPGQLRRGNRAAPPGQQREKRSGAAETITSEVKETSDASC